MSSATGTPTIGFEEAFCPISAEEFTSMFDRGVFPTDSRAFLWGGKILEKPAKSMPEAAVLDAFSRAIYRRIPPGMFVGHHFPIRLDAGHLPVPELIVAIGHPLDFFEARYPDGRDLLLVVEITPSPVEDLLDRYSRTLPLATSVVADIPNRRILIHNGPKADGGFESCEVVGPGGSAAIRLGDVELEPIPYDEVMR